MAKVEWYGRQCKVAITDEINKTVSDMCKKVVEAARSAMKAQSGITTKGLSKKKLGKNIRPHSAPGESPAIQTGLLYRSFRIRKTRGTTWQIKNTDPKAPLLEFGTRKMQARPFMKNAIRKVFGADIKLYSTWGSKEK